MRILVIGSGGREHAIAWKLAQSTQVTHVYCAPGNAGTYREPKVENVDISTQDFEKLAHFVKSKGIHYTVVGPEAPLVAGIVDFFNERGLLILGPVQKAAQLEGSKVFAKAFMQKHGIPTAQSVVANSLESAEFALSNCSYPIVIKADGLAAGKGVIIAQDQGTALEAVNVIFSEKRFGQAGDQVLIEEFITGEEVSFIVLADGTFALPLATSQDHKTRDDGDTGPNTGGMGAYSPSSLVTPLMHQQIMTQVIEPTMKGMIQEGTPFKGFIYAGLMITPNNEIRVLEYNCRFGDPETQPILMRLKSDFSALCLAAIEGRLDHEPIKWDEHVALGVVLAANGYPDAIATGDVIPTINNIPPSQNYKVFHAGTTMLDGKIVTNGGRVLCVTALGETIQEAQSKAYRIVQEVAWEGVFYRHDIGHRAIKREQSR